MNVNAVRPIDLVTVVLAVMSILLLIRTMALGSKMKKLRKAYVQFMGVTGVENLEQVIIDIRNQIDIQEEVIEQLASRADQLERKLKDKKGNVGIRRYNAFADRGSDLSFSLAIVNDDEDGLVLSGIHSRDQTFVYAKPVKQGKSDYPLSPEEKQALNLAGQRDT
ncbi:DUF4446 family protein [Paenibacillus humicola]|uniref:DUF4446 family protein n=1 Tax=Paenibacillus humicola TaxID=3110540 RepID=UPI00237A40D9|nr:DUF4446 family protein [Paenibacillus humicola]